VADGGAAAAATPLQPGAPGAACLAACPPADAVDALCAAHDFCVYAQLQRLRGWGNCSYAPPGGGKLARVPANQCTCDAALYRGITALGGSDGFKGNLLLWLRASWGRCLDVDAAGNAAGCLRFRDAVSPEAALARPVAAPSSGGRRAAAAAGVAAGVAAPLLLLLRARRGGAAAAAQALGGGVRGGDAGGSCQRTACAAALLVP
jgi:hypothetical protein